MFTSGLTDHFSYPSSEGWASYLTLLAKEPNCYWILLYEPLINYKLELNKSKPAYWGFCLLYPKSTIFWIYFAYLTLVGFSYPN
jgi:hypothetical protein